MPWLPRCFVSAMKADISNFISQYVLLETDSYQQFEELWFKLNFDEYHAYSGRRGRTRKCIEYILDQMNALLLEVFRDGDRIEQVCAFYLMYGLFFTQPLEIPIRIRFTDEDLEVLSMFCEENKSKNLEISYCYWKLINEEGLDFVFSPFPYTTPYIVLNQAKGKKKKKYTFEKAVRQLGAYDFDMKTYRNTLDEYFPLRFNVRAILPDHPELPYRADINTSSHIKK